MTTEPGLAHDARPYGSSGRQRVNCVQCCTVCWYMLQSGVTGSAATAAAPTSAAVPRPTELFYSKLNPLLKERVSVCLLT